MLDPMWYLVGAGLLAIALAVVGIAALVRSRRRAATDLTAPSPPAQRIPPLWAAVGWACAGVLAVLFAAVLRAEIGVVDALLLALFAALALAFCALLYDEVREGGALSFESHWGGFGGAGGGWRMSRALIYLGAVVAFGALLVATGVGAREAQLRRLEIAAGAEAGDEAGEESGEEDAAEEDKADADGTDGGDPAPGEGGPGTGSPAGGGTGDDAPEEGGDGAPTPPEGGTEEGAGAGTGDAEADAATGRASTSSPARVA